MSDKPVFDEDVLRAQTFDDPDVMEAVLTLYLDQVTALVPVIEAQEPKVVSGVAPEIASEIASAAHTLKGASLGVGCQRFAAVLGRISDGGADGLDWQAFAALRDETVQAVETFKRQIATI